jgi:hypothetical protein
MAGLQRRHQIVHRVVGRDARAAIEESERFWNEKLSKSCEVVGPDVNDRGLSRRHLAQYEGGNGGR